MAKQDLSARRTPVRDAGRPTAWRIGLGIIIVVMLALVGMLLVSPERAATVVETAAKPAAPYVEATAPSYPPAMGDFGSPATPRKRVIARVPAAPGSGGWKFAPVNSDGASVGQLYSQLEGKAPGPDTGELIVKLAYKLDDCRAYLNQRRATSSVLKSGGGVPQDLQAALERETQRSGPTCSDTTPEIMTASDRFVEQLAAQGDEQAMYAYATKLNFTQQQQQIFTDPERYAAFKRTAVDYLERLAATGHQESLTVLAFVYSNPVFNREDPVKAWAYMYASAITAGQVDLQQRLQEGSQKRFSPTDQARARLEAQQILATCCTSK